MSMVGSSTPLMLPEEAPLAWIVSRSASIARLSPDVPVISRTTAISSSSSVVSRSSTAPALRPGRAAPKRVPESMPSSFGSKLRYCGRPVPAGMRRPMKKLASAAPRHGIRWYNTVMQTEALLERLPNHRFRVTGHGRFAVSAEGATQQEAISNFQRVAAETAQNTMIIQVDVPLGQSSSADMDTDPQGNKALIQNAGWAVKYPEGVWQEYLSLIQQARDEENARVAE